MRWLCLAVAALAACQLADLIESPPSGARLQFAVQPSQAEAGAIMRPIQVVVLDVAGEPDTSYRDSVVIALGANPGGATLSGDTVAAVDQGLATFANLRISNPGKGYVLRASAPQRPAAMSAAFDITPEPGVPVVTAIVVTPATASLQTGGTQQFAATATLSNGSTQTNPSVTWSATGGTINTGGLYTAGSSAGTFRVIAASANGRADTSAVTLTAPPPPPPPPQATGLRFTVQPSNTGLLQEIRPPVRVMVLDAQGNHMTGYTGAVTVALAPNLLGAQAFGTLTVNAVNGIATFSNVRVNLIGVNYRLRAAFAGQAPIVTSNAFNVLL